MKAPPNKAAGRTEARPADKSNERIHCASQPAKSKQQIHKPFIPAWLDDAGLSAAEMRVFIHLLRSADNKTGVAWPSYRRMIEVTGLSKTTIRRCIESLENPHALVAKLGKPFAGSCRYMVLPTVPPQGQKEDSNSSTTGTIEAAPIVPPQTRNSSTRGTSIVPPEGQEGNPKKVLQGRVSNSGKSYSLEAEQFASWFKSSLPPETKPASNWQKAWAKTYDDLVNKDRRPPEEIRAVCKFARTDNFWQSNFQSPTKLRKRNKDGILFYDLFLQKIKHPVGNTAKPQAAVTTELRPAIIEEL